MIFHVVDVYLSDMVERGGDLNFFLSRGEEGG